MEPHSLLSESTSPEVNEVWTALSRALATRLYVLETFSFGYVFVNPFHT
jgi:hypothetical protein